MHAFSVLGMRVHREPVTFGSGDQWLASFTLEHGSIVISRVRLMREPSGAHHINFAREGSVGRIIVSGATARDALLQAALAAYHARAPHERTPAGTPLATATPVPGNAHDDP